MTRTLLIALAAALALGSSSGTASGRSDANATPTLRLVRMAPLAVRGEHFRAGERVRFKVNGRQRAARAAANRRGAFVVTLGDRASRCDTVRVLAVGSAGSRVVLKILPSPACSPARTP